MTALIIIADVIGSVGIITLAVCFPLPPRTDRPAPRSCAPVNSGEAPASAGGRPNLKSDR